MELTFWTAIRLLLGYFVSLLIGHMATSRALRCLWRIAQAEAQNQQDSLQNAKPIRTTPKIAFWHGVAERFFYTSTVLIGSPEGIAVFLAYKAVMRWQVYKEDVRNIPGSAIYIIGTVISLAFGVLGALIALWRFKL